MKPNDFPESIRRHLMPSHQADLHYDCIGCGQHFPIAKLLYTCPDCGQVLLIKDRQKEALKNIPGHLWRQIFDYRRMLNLPALKGIFRYHEFIAPIIPLDAVLYLGEGHTPLVEANAHLQKVAGVRFYFKNDGQNPSASFKDRGMASALSYIHYLLKEGLAENVLAICASTGDTSAAAALYASYLQPAIKSAVLLPHGKVTAQQLSQPLGSGAAVFEIPGVFDDCMKIVEHLSKEYAVALLNSKNAWRILGQESYAYEICQDLEYDLNATAVVVPIGNAGNITAVMSGFLKFHQAGIIERLPKIIGVQSEHADPVYRYYAQPVADQRRFEPVTVRPSAAQAAMIGNPVSMPRVMRLVEQYQHASGGENIFFVQVSEQKIMDWQLTANRNGHIVCTHGGETLAGMIKARRKGFISAEEKVILDSTAHALKFSGFQEMYFEDRFPSAYEIVPRPELKNHPTLVKPDSVEQFPSAGHPLTGEALDQFITGVAKEIAQRLKLEKK